jgi:ParB/RepB/Spo0J family partition protein
MSADFDMTKGWAGWVPVGEVARNPDQPRRRFDKAALEALARSLKTAGQQQPCSVVPHPQPHGAVRWLLVDGERRWRAAKIAGVSLWVAYCAGRAELGQDLGQLHAASFAANWCREGHTKAETLAAIQAEMRRGQSVQEVAAMAGKSVDWVELFLGLQKLHPDLLAQMDPPTPKNDRLSHKVALELTRHPVEEQEALWRELVAAVGHNSRLQFHRLRKGGALTRDNRPSTVMRYLTGRLRTVSTALQPLRDMTGKMLHKLPLEDLLEAQRRLGDLRVVMAHLAELVERAMQRKEGASHD